MVYSLPLTSLPCFHQDQIKQANIYTTEGRRKEREYKPTWVRRIMLLSCQVKIREEREKRREKRVEERRGKREEERTEREREEKRREEKRRERRGEEGMSDKSGRRVCVE